MTLYVCCTSWHTAVGWILLERDRDADMFAPLRPRQLLDHSDNIVKTWYVH
eukprot:COSAG01_NODE_67326_length_267_cov_0.922619_1_plen_50_part_01